MKKNLLVLIALFLALTIGCSASDKSSAPASGEAAIADESDLTKGDPITLVYTEGNSESHPLGQAAVFFKNYIAEKTNNRITVDLYFDMQLGDEKAGHEGMQIGTIDIGRSNATTFCDYGVPAMGVFGMPFTFESLEHLQNFLTSESAGELLAEVGAADNGMVAVSFWPEGSRNLFFSKTPVSKLSDMENLKIRVPETELMIDVFTALGTNPTPLSYSELYTSIQSGVVDGAENTLSAYIANSFYEVAPYYVKDAHTFSPGIIVFSDKTWAKLTDAEKALMKEAAEAARDYLYELTLKSEAENEAKLSDLGVTILEVEDLPEWQKAVEPIYAQYGEDMIALIKDIQQYK